MLLNVNDCVTKILCLFYATKIKYFDKEQHKIPLDEFFQSYISMHLRLPQPPLVARNDDSRVITLYLNLLLFISINTVYYHCFHNVAVAMAVFVLSVCLPQAVVVSV